MRACESVSMCECAGVSVVECVCVHVVVREGVGAQ